MKKLIFLLVIVLLVGALVQPQYRGYAYAGATPTSTPSPTALSAATPVTGTPGTPSTPGLLPAPVNDPNFVDFQTLGQNDHVMNGPYSSVTVRFSQPATWKLQHGAVLRLDIGAFFSRQAQYSRNGGAALTVSFNKVWVTTVMINWDGDQTVTIPIPDRALTPTLLSGEHSLNLFLDASVDCYSGNQTTITIRSTSGLELPHDIVSPTTNLAQIPAPFYQVDSFRPDPVTLVVPQNASADELRAALIVEAAFGRFSGGTLDLPVVTSDLVSAASTSGQIRQGHLIFVGKAGGFPDLTQVAFPAPVQSGKVGTQSIQPDDGVVEMALSPWDKSKAVLYVGGTSDVGVVKAAQALSSGALREGSQPGMSVISDVNASIEIPVPATDRTLSDLGYVTSDTLTGYGFVSTGYQFSIPPGMVAGQDAYIDLVYTHSALLDFARSGLVIMLNGQAIGSARYSEATAKTINTLRVGLPAYALRPGVNRLEIDSDLVPVDYCSTLIASGLWISIVPTTLIHLPLIQAEAVSSIVQPDLSRYPYPFISDPTLGTTSFVLPKNDLKSLNIAASVASELGSTATGGLLSLGTYYGDKVPADARQNNDFLIIGRATTLPVISEINASLPAPFAPNSDIAVERGMRVTYRLPEGTDLGYVQLLSSPWNGAHTILAVLGSSDKSLVWAGNVITDTRWRSRINGNFAVSNNAQVLTSDTRLGVGTNLSATSVPISLTPIVTPAPVAVQARPSWLLPAIVVTLVLIVLLILVVLLSNRGRKEPR